MNSTVGRRRFAERCFGRDRITSVRPLIGLARAETALGKRFEAALFRERARRVAATDRQAYVEWGVAMETAFVDRSFLN